MNKFNFTKEDFIEKDKGVDLTGKENTLSAYLGSINYRQLTNDEEKIITRAAAAGNEEAKEILYLTNLRLVIANAKAFRYRGIEFIDLIQEGNLALLHAVERFDPSKGFKFSTYAYNWVKLSLNRFVDDKSRAIRIPIYVVQNIIKVEEVAKSLEAQLKRKITSEDIFKELSIPNKVITKYKKLLLNDDIFNEYLKNDEAVPFDIKMLIVDDYKDVASKDGLNIIEETITLYNKHKKVPTNNQIAKKVNLSIKEIEKLLSYNNTISSLNAEINNSEGDKTEFGALIEDNKNHLDEVYQNDNKYEVAKVLNKLPYRTAQIIRLRFGFIDGVEHTLEEIGDKMDLSKERVRQIIKEQLDDKVFQRDLLKAMSYEVSNTDNGSFKLINI